MWKTHGYEAADTLTELGEVWVIDRNILVKILSNARVFLVSNRQIN
jgi:hypothetical protein